MTIIQAQSLPTTSRLLKALALSILVAAILLVTVILPAEYAIDPTGIGERLGLDVLADTAESTQASGVQGDSTPAPARAAGTDSDNEALKAAEAFGVNAGQSFDTRAVGRSGTTIRRDTLTVELPPGKGAEVKAQLKSGEGLAFRWAATGDVAVDMHGERDGVKNAWTSYWVERAQRAATGTFVAPFEGSHGWYWENRGSEPVTVEIEVTGFQESLYQPGQS